MADYKSMYLRLFNRVSDTIAILQEAQQQTEESYVLDFPPPAGETESDAES